MRARPDYRPRGAGVKQPVPPNRFHAGWDTVAQLLSAATAPLTRQEIRAAWPAGLTRPHEATLWRWLDRAVELNLAQCTDLGTRNVPYRYGLAR